MDDLVDREYEGLQRRLGDAHANFVSVNALDRKQERRLLVGTMKALEKRAYDPTGRKTTAKTQFDINAVPKSNNALMSLYNAEKQKQK